jgi:hypothetical protein
MEYICVVKVATWHTAQLLKLHFAGYLKLTFIAPCLSLFTSLCSFYIMKHVAWIEPL